MNIDQLDQALIMSSLCYMSWAGFLTVDLSNKIDGEPKRLK